MWSRLSSSGVFLQSKVLPSPSMTTKSVLHLELLSGTKTSAVNVPRVGKGSLLPYANSAFGALRDSHWIP